MSTERRISVDNGKYTLFVPDKDYRVHALRYGEPWHVIEQGCNAISSLMAELIESRELIAAVREWAGIGPNAGSARDLFEAFKRYCSLRGEPLGNVPTACIEPVVPSVSECVVGDVNESESRLIEAALGISHPGRAPRIEELDALFDKAIRYAAARRITDCADDACPNNNSCRGCGDDIPLGTKSCGALECGGRTLTDLGGNAP